MFPKISFCRGSPWLIRKTKPYHFDSYTILGEPNLDQPSSFTSAYKTNDFPTIRQGCVV